MTRVDLALLLGANVLAMSVGLLLAVQSRPTPLVVERPPIVRERIVREVPTVTVVRLLERDAVPQPWACVVARRGR